MARRRSRKPRPVSLASALLLLSGSVPSKMTVAADAPSVVSDSKCDCFVTNGSDVAYYSHHKFFDYRNLSQYQGAPALLQDAGDTTSAPASSPYFTNDSFTSFWEIQNWNNTDALGASSSAVMRINSLNNVYIEQNTDPNNSSATWLTLRTARQPMFQSTAEIVTKNDTFQFISMRMLARTIGSPGGCTAMFTYRAPPDGSASSGGGTAAQSQLQEVDLEVLTKYPRTQVQCTNQPSVDNSGQLIAAATQNVSLPDQLGWDNWTVYRLDWTPRQSTWYAEGQQIANISFQTPRDPSRIHINAWSDGGNWTGIMPFKTEAHLQIQWWEVLYNSTAQSSSKSNGNCSNVCSIDATNGTIGQTVLLFSSAAPGQLLFASPTLVGWVPAIATAFMLLVSLSL